MKDAGTEREKGTSQNVASAWMHGIVARCVCCLRTNSTVSRLEIESAGGVGGVNLICGGRLISSFTCVRARGIVARGGGGLEAAVRPFDRTHLK